MQPYKILKVHEHSSYLYKSINIVICLTILKFNENSGYGTFGKFSKRNNEWVTYKKPVLPLDTSSWQSSDVCSEKN
jgi:hypothetical protein